MGSGNAGKKRNNENITGQVFERLTAIEAVGTKYSQAGAMLGTLWECRCECGNTRVVLRKLLGRVTKECETCANIKRPRNFKGYKRPPVYTPVMASVLTKIRLYRRKSRSRIKGVDLTDKQMYELFIGECFYCGKIPDLTGPVLPTSRLNGIDRMDSSKGYTIDNSVSCCKYCNYAKNDLSFNDFLDLVKRIANKHNL